MAVANRKLAGGPGDVPTLDWSEEFSVGVPEIDADHRMLFELIGVLADAPASQRIVSESLDALAEYVGHHFAREERYQEAIGFPGLAAHRVLHRQLAERLASFRAIHDVDPSRVDVGELRNFLRHWLINHVLHEDMQFRWFVEGHYPDPEA